MITVRLPKELKKKKMGNSLEIYSVIRPILLKKNKISRDKEHMWLMILDSCNHIKHLELIGLGTVESVAASPMEVFSVALHRRAVKLAIIHNHPSGNTEPSSSDLELTLRLQNIGLLLGIPIVDHLVISLDGYFSFKDDKVLLEPSWMDFKRAL